jgi:acetyl esterase/lipase
LSNSTSNHSRRHEITASLTPPRPGLAETPEFQRQNREFAAAVKAAGNPVQLLVGENYNHFELPETLCNPYGLLGRAALDLMGLTAGVGRLSASAYGPTW